jgi:UDP-3-O-[3-hydroxymyristoyl] glucosamine N-acyltransferase
MLGVGVSVGEGPSLGVGVSVGKGSMLGVGISVGKGSMLGEGTSWAAAGLGTARTISINTKGTA